MSEDYEDIIDRPHHVSVRHKQMTMKNRAAQFAPFAALSGYEAAIEKVGLQNLKQYESDIREEDEQSLPFCDE